MSASPCPTRVVSLAAVVAVLTAVYACDNPTSVETPLIQTGLSTYEVEVDALGDLATSVDYTFTNETGATVYIVNCQRQFHLRLERREGEIWVPAWSAFIPDCLSPPITIDPGQTFNDQIRIWSGCPSSGSYPELDCENPAGTYRIVWIDALSSFRDSLPFGPQIPLPYRVSNSFELVTR